MSLSSETEADTRAERIEPILREAGWGTVPGSRIRREVICPGRIQAGGGRSRGLSCDFVLTYKGQKLAVLEAKRAGLSHREGVAQAKNYASRLGTRFAYASNGIEWYSIDRSSGSEGDFQPPFPTPDELWGRTFSEANEWRDRFGEVEFETDGGKWEPRYYQHKAVNAVLDAIGKGDKRVLLTLATGTGKTSIAFQIAWKLYQARWSLKGDTSRHPRILFLADRNILATQAMGDFSAFDPKAVTRISPSEIRKRGGSAPRNASVFFTIFQTFMTGDEDRVYEAYPSDFFDFIVIDECHRGGARDESPWRKILEYFSPAVQLGLTATPKRKHNADTYSYFGEPVYTYALKDGIEDGFLTPFKVRQMASTIDEYVYDPKDEVLAGEVQEGRRYTENDFNRIIEIPERELSRVKEFMSQTDQSQKTLVFCATQKHAADVRDLINQVKDSTDPDYCHRVTAEDGVLGEEHLKNFRDNAKTIPTILTTSQKLSTGVDARNVRHIVLMRPVRSMIEFKQIIGRGTRTFDGKGFFTVWDFVKAHENFSDPEWDGEPEEPVEPTSSPPGEPPEPPADPDDEEDVQKPSKLVVRLPNDTVRNITYVSATTYWSADGSSITAAEFLKQVFGDVSELISNEDELRNIWSDPENRQHLLSQLEDRGYDVDRLDDLQKLVDAPDSDLFDVLAYVLFSVPPKSRQERIERAEKEGLEGEEEEMKELLLGILRAYKEGGSSELAQGKLEGYLRARFGGVFEAGQRLGGIPNITSAFKKLQSVLYRP